VPEQRRSPADGIFVAARPWGQFQQFVENSRVTVKVITVHAGCRLSLQKHGHRDEMWQVLDCPIYVEVDGRDWEAEVGEVVWVPSGAEHRMTNRGERAGRLLEIAFGDFDESDIVRIEDDYAREEPDA
jgi:mannose-6-phosphate isomerase